jgi:uncharacterized protein (DUF2236 family)
MRNGRRSLDAAEFEQSLRLVCTNAAGANAGVFGPESQIWQVDREAVVFLGAGRALLMQLAHPWVATAIAQHSTALDDPIGRFHRTLEIVFTLVFGSLDQALSASRRLHLRHGAVSGLLPETIGPFPAGSRYEANEISALRWVHATLVDTALTVYELVLAPLGAEARERYYVECRRLGLLFGISIEEQPSDWTGFAAYIQETIASERLAVGRSAREIAAGVLSGAGSVPLPRSYRDVTAALLPEALRDGFQLGYGERERRTAARAIRFVRGIYPALPRSLRYVAPYHEAVARLSGRRPDLLTRSLNRLWIGRTAMPD